MYTLDTVLNFGIFNGCALWEVIQDRPTYVVWMINEMGVVLDNEAYSALTNTGVDLD